MLTAEFSKNSLRSMIRWSDHRYNVLKAKHLRENYLSNLEQTIADNTFKFDKLRTLRVGSFSAFQPTRLGDTLVMRRINKIVRNIYSTKQSDRNAIVHQAQILLEESCPKHIYKLDISKFYESIDRDFLLEKLRSDSLLSSTTLNLISMLFEHFSKYMRHGLPRGLSISSTLSELYLKNLDQSITAMDSVYYYGRYVDDILIFASKEKPEIFPSVQELLPGKMRLNLEKCFPYYIGCLCAPKCSCATNPCNCAVKCKCPAAPEHEINYLGYKLITSRIPKKDKHKTIVVVEMADSKIRRLKSRMVKAFLDHRKRPDFELLKSRIKFLTENHRIKTPGRRGKLMSGIHFNYPLISNPESFKSIDEFLKSQLYASNGAYGMQQTQLINLQEKSEIAKLSFVSGFAHRRSKSISAPTLKKIRRCW
jgi:hypothetical protein